MVSVNADPATTSTCGSFQPTARRAGPAGSEATGLTR